LFGRSFQSNDKIATENIKGLARRWQKVLEKALNQDVSGRYGMYESMLSDVRKAVNRNKRMAVASIPFWLILLAIGSYFAYEKYQIAEVPKPQPSTPVPDEQAILRPFDKIEAPE
jgi:hypothetical protein